MKELQVEFEHLYKNFYAALCRASVNIVKDSDVAHDIVQEVFIKLYDKQEKWPAIQDMKAYLYRAVVNASINHYKSRKKFTAVPLHMEATGDNTDAGVLRTEAERSIHAELEKLPPQCRTIMMLSRFEGLKNKEIAAYMGLSLKTVENQMGIALKKLRTGLKSYFAADKLAMLLVPVAAAFSHFL